MISLLLLSCFAVTVGPGWSEPFVVTDSANTTRREQLLYQDEIGRNHLVWAGFNDESRIAYKIFSTDGGTELYPETMISDDVNSAYLTITQLGESLYAFWRTYTPIYTAARNIPDGSEAVPSTYLLTTSTIIPQVRSSPDSLGRLHVLYNGGYEGMEVFYAVWSPSPDSGFTTEYEWIIEGADDGGVILVDENRVHVVVQDSLVHNYLYTQYDLEGNTVIPMWDFTSTEYYYSSRFPELTTDCEGNLLIVSLIDDPSQGYRYGLWKLHGETGELLIDCETIVGQGSPEPWVSPSFVLRPLPGKQEFYLAWSEGMSVSKVYFLVFNALGDIVHDWTVAYDFSDEEPEDTRFINGAVDTSGNLYIIFSQVETEPQIDYFPTFGWFDYSTLGIEDSTSSLSETQFTISQNPVTGSVTVFSEIDSPMNLRVFDLAGREVSSISLNDGVGVWNGIGFSGERLPAGVYSIAGEGGFHQKVTLLDR